jgi:hypothetical protein
MGVSDRLLVLRHYLSYWILTIYHKVLSRQIFLITQWPKSISESCHGLQMVMCGLFLASHWNHLSNPMLLSESYYSAVRIYHMKDIWQPTPCSCTIMKSHSKSRFVTSRLPTFASSIGIQGLRIMISDMAKKGLQFFQHWAHENWYLAQICTQPLDDADCQMSFCSRS